MKTDIFGNTLETALKIFGENHADSRIGLQDGIWLARFANRPDAYSQRRGAWKPQIGYAAITRTGEVVSNGTRRDTISLAKYKWKCTCK